MYVSAHNSKKVPYQWDACKLIVTPIVLMEKQSDLKQIER